MSSADDSNDLRQFLRELTLRHERGFAAMQQGFVAMQEGFVELQGSVAAMERSVAAMEKSVAAMQESLEALRAEVARNTEALDRFRREVVSELRAQRKALFQILDRLPETGGRGGAAA